jgi:hypothetical protein
MFRGFIFNMINKHFLGRMMSLQRCGIALFQITAGIFELNYKLVVASPIALKSNIKKNAFFSALLFVAHRSYQ